jgi:phosphoglycolate phosphatase-like HAD superfamily hydrolase
LNQKKNLIVFDIDDTITKSGDQHVTAYVEAMQHFGITKIDQNWKTYKHHTDSYILKQNYEHNFEEAFDFSFIKDFEAKMTDSLLALKEVQEIQGARAIVDFFATETNYAISFATGSLLQPAFIKLNQAQINFEERLVVGANAIYEREDIVKRAIKRAKDFYQVDFFENIISVGDGIWDLTTARNLDVHFIGIGEKNYADFERENIKVHIKDWMGFDLRETERVLGIGG